VISVKKQKQVNDLVNKETEIKESKEVNSNQVNVQVNLVNNNQVLNEVVIKSKKSDKFLLAKNYLIENKLFEYGLPNNEIYAKTVQYLKSKGFEFDKELSFWGTYNTIKRQILTNKTK
jgi:hypothetical protein